MQLNWRKWFRAFHRDMGYLFFALTVIYAVSGIAVNHIGDWNPSYVIESREVLLSLPDDPRIIGAETVKQALQAIGEEEAYKKHYFPASGQIKIFLDGGSLVADLSTGQGMLERISRRPILHQFNFLHYNPGKWWTLVSDIFAVALVLLAFTGLFLVRGSRGITGRGAWLTLIGIVVPLLFLFLFY